MKKTFFVALAAMTLTLSANAQSKTSSSKSKPDQSEMIQQRTDEMVSTYGLSSKQAKKLQKLNEKYEGNSNSEAYNKELKSIIGDENYSKYESSSKKQMQQKEKKSKD